MVWKNDQVNKRETEEILRLAEAALAIEGDYVEFGCYRGDTSLLLAEIVEKPVENSVVGKRLWLYDSFEGLPEKKLQDESAMGEDFKQGELYVTKREVKERFLRAGLRVPIIKKAWFEELTIKDLPGKIAFAFIDGDFYDSIKIALSKIEDKMTKGGVILVHDYNNPALPGAAKAVDEWLEGKNLRFKQFESLVEIFPFS